MNSHKETNYGFLELLTEAKGFAMQGKTFSSFA